MRRLVNSNLCRTLFGVALRIMKQVAPAAIAILAGVNIAHSAPPNKAPTVSITAPVNGATFMAGSNLTITATAADADGTVAKVEFYRGGTILLGTATASPYAIVWSSVPAGTYSLTAVATDDKAATKTSIAISVTATIPPNTPPAVTLLSPANGAMFTAPATVALAANASDSDGTVTRVEFYQGTTLVGTITAAPYTSTWSNVGVGSYVITAKATDNLGATKTSAAVGIAVGPTNKKPLVVLTAPTPCTIYDAPASIGLIADAVDLDGTIARVDFLEGGIIRATATTAPYSGTLTGLPPGTYTLIARATDNQGAVSDSTPVTVTVRSNNQPPLVNLTAPAGGSTYSAPASIVLAANASDPDGNIARVEFYSGSTLLGTVASAPYTYTWTNVTAGGYTLTAKAIDNLGATTICAAVNITVTNAAPTVTLTAPVTASRYLPSAIVSLAANASDPDGSITRVEFLADGNVIATSVTAPFTGTWNAAPPGTHVVTARAFDNGGSTAMSAPATISIDAPPSVTITAPIDGAIISAPGNLVITAQATDSDGSLTRVELFRDGVSVGAATPPTGNANFTFNYNWNSAPAGSYTLTAQATDNDGATSTSPAVRVIVRAAPTVTLTAPSAGSSFQAPASITLTATPTATGATIVKVDFYSATTLIGTATAAPYSFVWNGVPVGNYSLTAVVTDSLGSTATSPAVSVRVSNNIPPSVVLTAPANAASYFAPAAITLAANASDSDGTVTLVQFYQGTSLLGTAATPPYTLRWNGVANGTYVLTAVATDNDGGRTTSAPVTISVSSTGFAITAPADGTVTDATAVNVAGIVQAPDNAGITVNGMLAARDDTGNFYVNGVPLTTGSNTITATLTHPDGTIETRSVSLSSTVDEPIVISALPTQGLAPFDVTFTASARPGVTIQKMEIDFNGDGVFDYTKFEPDWAVMATGYSVSSGVYAVSTSVRVTDTQGNVYTKTIPIVISTVAALDQKLRAVWSGMTSALAAGDKATAMRYLNDQAQLKYAPVLDALLSQMPQLVAGLSALTTLQIATSFGEYAINQIIDGVNRLYFVHLLLDADGVWRIDSM